VGKLGPIDLRYQSPGGITLAAIPRHFLLSNAVRRAIVPSVPDPSHQFEKRFQAAVAVEYLVAHESY
jgi:hypothetical protein